MSQAAPVVVTRLPQPAYRTDYVALPKDYGSERYFARADVRDIYTAVFSALDTLNERSGFTQELARYERLLIKPNLVSVYHRAGMRQADYPASTDPRVLDALIAYLKRFHAHIVIVESAGKPMPTPTCFRTSGIDRLARHHGVELIALERRPVVRYMLPKAEVMREIYIPDTFVPVVEGRDYYISVPKMKTNLYTGVTLGLKNAMGTIPYFLRERNHNYRIASKLADIQYLFTPHLVLVDGVVAGDGNTPAPVLPVDTRAILCGHAPLAVDRVAARMMGVDPDALPLFQEAAKRLPEDPPAEIIGDATPTVFRGANPSLMDAEFRAQFPGVLALAGHTVAGAPPIAQAGDVSPDTARALELACGGGCLSALRSGFEYVTHTAPEKRDFPLAVVIGSGVPVDGTRLWFDHTGKAYDEAAIRALPQPKYVMGSCSQTYVGEARYRISGCCDPAAHMVAACKAAGVLFPLLSPRNQRVLDLAGSLIGTFCHKTYWILRGRWVDCPRSDADRVFPIASLSPTDAQQDFLPWPLPRMRFGEKLRAIADHLSLFKL